MGRIGTRRLAQLATAIVVLSLLALVSRAGFMPAEATDRRRPAVEIVGIASVIAGDTIEIHDRRIRLDGIDAPESSQLCLRDRKKERCGQVSAIFLADLIGRQTVRCERHDVDRYGRDIATCWLGATNLNEAMVQAGQAVAYRKYSMRYVPVEEAARTAGMGVWSTEFDLPWSYRQRH
jgi:endonuclease YncB( thermonuclease family)